jgi:hypothetical protein
LAPLPLRIIARRVWWLTYQLGIQIVPYRIRTADTNMENKQVKNCTHNNWPLTKVSIVTMVTNITWWFLS